MNETPMMNEMKTNTLFQWKEDIYRVLDCTGDLEETADKKIFVINCGKQTMPRWVPVKELEDTYACTEDDLLEQYPLRTLDEPNSRELKTARERYAIISPVLPFVSHDQLRTQAVKKAAQASQISTKTVTNYLCAYLSYKTISALAPKKTAVEKELTKDQKNIRWALNKFYYTRHRNTLADAYVMMLKERYTDEAGKLLPEHPSIYQFRYYYRQNKSLQKEYISRDGIKNYEMNSRPLLGDGVHEFARSVGYGMLDATICDIYLCDEAGSLVGRPVLTACVDAFSGMVCGYSLLWEGGMYSVRELLLNCIADKVEWCGRFGILIEKEDWDCQELPGILVTDKGAEFKSYTMEQAAELGCSIINLPSFRAELKGPVEQIFNCAQNLFKPYLKGKGVIEPDFQKRGVRDYRKDACLTMEQFEQIILRCILYYNTKRVVENFPYTEEMLQLQIPPHADSIWNYWKKQPGAKLLHVTEEKLVQTMLPRAAGRFTRSGLKVNQLRYRADGYTEEYLQGESVTVAYNPEDTSVVYLIKDGYQKFQLIETRFASMSFEQVQDIRKRQRSLARSCEEEKLQAKVELAGHIQTIASQRKPSEQINLHGIRDARQRQTEKRHRDLIQELSRKGKE